MTRVLKIIDSGGVIAGTSGISLIDPATIIGTKGGLNSLSLSASDTRGGLTCACRQTFPYAFAPNWSVALVNRTWNGA